MSARRWLEMPRRAFHYLAGLDLCDNDDAGLQHRLNRLDTGARIIVG
jgi:hypothetical protein